MFYNTGMNLQSKRNVFQTELKIHCRGGNSQKNRPNYMKFDS